MTIEDNFQPLGSKTSAYTIRPASNIKRLAATLIDLALYAIPVGFLLLGDRVYPRDGSVSNFIVTLAPISLIAVVVLQWVLLAVNAQSLGKMLLRIQIVCVDGKSANFVRTVILRRWLPSLIDAVAGGCFSLLIDWPFIFGSNHRCLHDHIAGTVVIDVP